MQIVYENLKHQILHQYWGYSSFRALQEEIIDSILLGKDTVALLPTGGGKSICYQLPALLFEGVCLVVSPLLALMKDQVLQLQKINIPAEYLSSEMEDYHLDIIYKKCRDGEVKILFVSPERLLNSAFLFNIQDIHLSFIAVDEAHCISEWGQDFRPSYQNIQKFRADRQYLPCLALTATATPKVIKQIEDKLSLKNPLVFQQSYERTNLSLHIVEVQDRYGFILQLLPRFSTSGLIYTRTRREAEEICHFLKNKKILNVDFYHAGLSPIERDKKQKIWLDSPNHILISTNAFGMGIDKQDVGFIIHLSPPSSIENYYQEVGRAGRNGALAHTFLLWSPPAAVVTKAKKYGALAHTFLLWSPPQLANIDQIFANQFPSQKEFARIVRAIYSLCQIPDYHTSENTFQLSEERIAKVAQCTKAKIKSVLTFLHNQEYIYYSSSKGASAIQLLISSEDIHLTGHRNEYFLELLLRNFPGVMQQKVFFNEKKIAQKLNIDEEMFHEKLLEMQKNNFLEYIDGNKVRLNFLKPREDNKVEKKMWKIFFNNHKNKIQKWEEMKFFIQNDEYCKMALILSYFGEKKIPKKCGKCSVCQRKEYYTKKELSTQILETLKIKPMGLDELAIRLVYFDREDIFDTIVELRDAGLISMKDFRTYRLSSS